MDTLRFGVVGVKGRGGGLAAETSSIDGAEIVAVADRDSEAAREIAEQLGATAFGDCEAMLRESALNRILGNEPTSETLALEESQAWDGRRGR